jgi:hypothetical protein
MTTEELTLQVLNNRVILDIMAHSRLPQVMNLALTCRSMHTMICDFVLTPDHFLKFLRQNQFLLRFDSHKKMLPDRDIAAVYYGLRRLENLYGTNELFNLLSWDLVSLFVRIPYRVFLPERKKALFTTMYQARPY